MADLLDRYVTLLLDWNQKINLISRANAEGIWFSHILHSILPLRFVKLPGDIHLLDLGSGGGLPGVPISILRKDIAVTHVDSVTKKCTALQEMVTRLGLQNKVINSRVEELRGQLFDHVIARAVAPLPDLIKWSRPLVRRRKPPAGKDDSYTVDGPTLIAMKGGDLDDEIQRAKIKTGVSDIAVINMTLKEGTVAGIEDKKLILVNL